MGRGSILQCEVECIFWANCNQKLFIGYLVHELVSSETTNKNELEPLKGSISCTLNVIIKSSED